MHVPESIRGAGSGENPQGLRRERAAPKSNFISSPLRTCYYKTNQQLSAAHVHFFSPRPTDAAAQRFLSHRCGNRSSTLGCFAEGGKKRKNESRLVVYLVGFARELAAAELALDLPLGAVVLQVVGQVAARQLDRAAVGAGDDVEGAGGEVALDGGDKQRGVRGAMFGSRFLLDSGSRGSAGALNLRR